MWYRALKLTTPETVETAKSVMAHLEHRQLIAAAAPGERNLQAGDRERRKNYHHIRLQIGFNAFQRGVRWDQTPIFGEDKEGLLYDILKTLDAGATDIDGSSIGGGPRLKYTSNDQDVLDIRFSNTFSQIHVDSSSASKVGKHDCIPVLCIGHAVRTLYLTIVP